MKRFAANFEEYLGGLLMVVMVVAVFIGVVFRYVFNSPLQWVPEIATTTFIWQVFLGASVAVKRRGHIGVDMLTRLLPPGARGRVSHVVFAFSALFLCTMVYLSGRFVVNAAGNKTLTLEIPYMYVYLAVPVGLLLMAIRLVQELMSSLRHGGGVER